MMADGVAHDEISQQMAQVGKAMLSISGSPCQDLSVNLRPALRKARGTCVLDGTYKSGSALRAQLRLLRETQTPALLLENAPSLAFLFHMCTSQE